jgi:hypothetical protein
MNNSSVYYFCPAIFVLIEERTIEKKKRRILWYKEIFTSSPSAEMFENTVVVL